MAGAFRAYAAPMRTAEFADAIDAVLARQPWGGAEVHDLVT